MAGKPKSGARDSNQIAATAKPGEDDSVTRARTALRPSVQASVTLREYGKVWGDLDLSGLVHSLTEQIEATHEGDAARAEAMLTAQAHTLDAIFNNLARRAINADYMDHLERYLKLALRAQSQCRATWEGITAIKHPPVVGYVGQANIAQGHQQVNNGVPVTEGGRASESDILQNKLLEKRDGERLDTGTTSTPGRTDPAMATVGEVDGTEDRIR